MNKKFIIICFLFIVIRIFLINSVPIFIDEALYQALSKFIFLGENSVLISVMFGLPPLDVWLLIPFNFFNTNFLIYTRFFYILISLITLIFIYRLGKKYFNNRIAIIASLIYVFLPFSIFYDKLALKDPLIQLFGVIYIYVLFGNLTKKKILLTSIILILGILTKSLTYFFILLTPVFFIIHKPNLLNIKKLLLIIIPAIFLIIMWGSLPVWNNLKSFNTQFVNPIELITSPLTHIKGNTIQFISWVEFYWNWNLIVLILVGFVLLVTRFTKRICIIFLFFSVPIFIELFSAKFFFPRHFFFTTAFVVLFGAWVFDYIASRQNRYIKAILFLFLLLPLIWKDYKFFIAKDFHNFPEMEKWQYYEGWPSGYNSYQLISYLKNELINNQTEVIVEKYGLIYYLLRLYLPNENNLKISNNLLYTSDIREPIENFYTSDFPNKLIITNANDSLPSNWNVIEIKKIYKMNNKSSIKIYKVTSI